VSGIHKLVKPFPFVYSIFIRKRPVGKDLLETTEAQDVDNPKKNRKSVPEKAESSIQTKKTTAKKSKKTKKQYEQILFRDWCKACGLCSAFCPQKVIGRDKTGNPIIEHPDACIGCRFCEMHCPDFAITITPRTKEGAKKSS
jgi:2-oxoglutarate ferredoxin oxidoreductase subunit delta